MGFYGNKTSAIKSQFTFDKIYSNRAAMEDNCLTDNVYIGRFILVDYNSDGEISVDNNIRPVYAKEDSERIEGILGNEGIYLYSSSSLNEKTKIKFESQGEIKDNVFTKGVTIGDIVYTSYFNNRVLYACVDSIEDIEGNVYAIFAETGETKEGYEFNYHIDKLRFSNIGRGWDSTVWQKMYENGVEKYAMVAELNTVVPTFAISADAPTLTPIAPHFDEVSTNTYYEVHWQPQWGLRIKHANASLSEGEKTLSDEKTTWIKTVYDKDRDVTEKYYYCETENEDGTILSYWEKFESLDKIGEEGKLPAAIYYNKAGFNPEVHYHSSITDNLSISPTGYSQTPIYEDGEIIGWETTKYNDHNQGLVEQVDTQELSMILPALGNAINNVWDIIYGKGIQEDGSLAKENKSDVELKRSTYIHWDDATSADLTKERLRMIRQDSDGFHTYYTPEEANTLAGAINSTHDLMGRIIVDWSDREMTDDLNALMDKNKIYYLRDKNFYMAADNDYQLQVVNYIYQKPTEPVTLENYQQNYYYYKTQELDPETNELKDVYVADFAEEGSSFVDGREYFEKRVDYKKENGYEEYSIINLNQYEPGKYYYSLDRNYYLENSQDARPMAYYLLNPEKFETVELKYGWKPNKYHKYVYSEEIGGYKYILSQEDYPEKEKQYAYIDEESATEVTCYLKKPQLYDPSNEKYEGEKSLRYFYSPGVFWYHKGFKEDGTIDWGIELREKPLKPGEQTALYGTDGYYLCQHRWITEEYYDKEKQEYFEVRAIDWDSIQPFRVYFIEFNQDSQYYYINEDGDYVLLTQSEINKDNDKLGEIQENNTVKLYGRDCFSVNTDPIEEFYLPGVYWHEDNKNNFVIDTEVDVIKDRIYYLLPEPVVGEDKEENKDAGIIRIKNLFYAPNTYYKVIQVDEDTNIYELDKSIKKDPEATYARKNLLYISSDKEKLFGVGATWSKSIDVVPNTIELSYLTNPDECYGRIMLQGFGKELNTINGLILEINKVLSTEDYYTRDRKTVQGCINYINDILNKFEEFEERCILMTDNYGRVHSINPRTDAWLDIDIQGNVDKPDFYIEHMPPVIEEHDDIKININNDANIQTIELQTSKADEKGHLNGSQKTIITLPYNYKTIAADEGSTTAKKVQDTLNINGDSWIKTTANNTNNEIIIEHTYSGFEQEQTSGRKLNDKEIFATITIPAGRLRGDVDGDGIISEADVNIIRNSYINKSVEDFETTNIAARCADVNKDGLINESDVSILRYASVMDEHKYGKHLEDYMNNWIQNPNAQNEIAQYYCDISSLNTENITSELLYTLNENIVSINVLNEDTIRIFVRNIPLTEQEVIVYLKNVDNELTFNTMEIDSKGHVIKENIVTENIPYSFSMIGNKGKTIIASKNNDNIKLLDSDLISAKIYNEDNTIEFIHNDPIYEGVSIKNSKTILDFGSKLKIPVIYTGIKGHIYSIGSEELKLSDIGTNLLLTDYKMAESEDTIAPEDTIGDAFGKLELGLKNLRLEQISMKFDITAIERNLQNAGNLLLTEYTIGETFDSISETDTINSAFGKLELGLNNLRLEQLSTNLNIQNIKKSLGVNEGDTSITPIEEQIQSALENYANKDWVLEEIQKAINNLNNTTPEEETPQE